MHQDQHRSNAYNRKRQVPNVSPVLEMIRDVGRHVPLHVKMRDQLLSSLATSLVEADDDLSDGSGPSVHLQSRLRFLRPATGVSGAESLSDSEESLLSPV